MDNMLIIVIAIAAFFLLGCRCKGLGSKENFCAPSDVQYGYAVDQTGSNLSGRDDLSVADKKTIIEHRTKSKGFGPNSGDFNQNCGIPLKKYKKAIKKTKKQKEASCKKCKEDKEQRKKQKENKEKFDNSYLGMNEEIENFASI
jgi:hypothetical protein